MEQEQAETPRLQQQPSCTSNQIAPSCCQLPAGRREGDRPQCSWGDSEADTGSASLSEQEEHLTFGKPHTLTWALWDCIYEACRGWELRHLKLEHIFLRFCLSPSAGCSPAQAWTRSRTGETLWLGSQRRRSKRSLPCNPAGFTILINVLYNVWVL